MRLILALFALMAVGRAQGDGNDGYAPAPSWRMQAGDNPAWASPEFDDSSWALSEPPSRSLLGADRTNLYRWYRATFQLPEGMWTQKLAVGIGALDEVYDVYVEGVLTGRFGTWEPKPWAPFNKHRAFVVPDGVVNGPRARIAIRRWIGATPGNHRSLQASGLDRDWHEPRLGLAGVVVEAELSHPNIGVARNQIFIARLVVQFIAGLLILALYLSQDPKERAYLWLSLSFLVESLAQLAGGFVANSDLPWRGLAAGMVVGLEYSAPVLLALFFAFVIARRWRWLAYILAGSGMMRCLASAGAMVTQWTWVRLSPLGVILQMYFESVFLFLIVGLLLRQRRTGPMLLSAALVSNTLVTAYYFRPTSIHELKLGPVLADIRDIVGMLLPLAAVVYVYLGYRDEQKRQAAAQQDLLAARRVQQMLLESSGESAPGYRVEKQYLPAREVGGDFYQWIPQADGGLLLVAGDVSGKGLEAAMLASTMIGALRACGSAQPGAVLATLNQAAIARMRGGFVTCCAALFEPGGRLRVASAGHPAPYVGGRELAIDTGLPLGLSADANYPETESALGDDGQFTVVSDGVVEAENPQRELFGFDRTREVSTKPAQEIAEAAKQWGQNDDITVVTVRRPLT